jgi:uncharacterized damage-inducible protein DinB
MITQAYVQVLAEYNQWMNDKIYACAARLSDEQRREDRGAFFKSLHGTLKHIMWADNLWLGRFLTKPADFAPELDNMDFDQMSRCRAALDEAMLDWAKQLDEAWLEQPLTWFSGLYQQTFSQPGWLGVTHFFNHQTHHRGQATTLLMQFGIDPGATDLIFMTALDQSRDQANKQLVNEH